MLLCLTAAAVLSPSLGAGFIWDDVRQIVNSGTIDDPTAPLRYFSLNVVQSWGEEGHGADGVDTYRPLFFIALWTTYRINGADPFWFHLAVLTAHLGVCLLLWTLARRWVESAMGAAAVFAVFAIHPVTAEAYLWCSAISEPMSVAGLLGAMLILDRWCANSEIRWGAVAAAGIVTLGGLLSKEAVLTALPVLSLYLWRVRRVRLAALAGPWFAAVLFLILRVQALAGLQATGSGTAQRLEALRNLPVLVLDALWSMLSLQPVGMRQLYWDYRELSWAPSLLAAVTVVALIAVLWLNRRSEPLAFTAFGVLVCTLVPIALVSTVPGWGGFGRYLYLPWGFTALACAALGVRLAPIIADRAPRFRFAIPAIVVLFLGLELLGIARALDIYRTQESLARAAIELQPHAPDGWEWLGNELLAADDLAGAARCYAAAVDRAPELFRPRHNLAAALFYLGRPAEALDQEEIVRSRHGVTADGTVIAVRALLEMGRRDEAEQWLSEGLAHHPNDRRLRRLQSDLARAP
jgi:hypothetical protein